METKHVWVIELLDGTEASLDWWDHKTEAVIDADPVFCGFDYEHLRSDAVARARKLLPSHVATVHFVTYDNAPEPVKETAFVRPVRRAYRHLICGAVMTIAQPIAEAYARNPASYNCAFCARCGTHLPRVEFVWDGTYETGGS